MLLCIQLQECVQSARAMSAKQQESAEQRPGRSLSLGRSRHHPDRPRPEHGSPESWQGADVTLSASEAPEPAQGHDQHSPDTSAASPAALQPCGPTACPCTLRAGGRPEAGWAAFVCLRAPCARINQRNDLALASGYSCAHRPVSPCHGIHLPGAEPEQQRTKRERGRVRERRAKTQCADTGH